MLGDRSSTASRRWSAIVFLSVTAVSVLTVSARAQVPQVSHALPFPRLASVLPAGGKAGTVVDVTLAGADLEEPQELRFSLATIKAEPIVPPPPPPPDPKNPPKDPPKPTPVTQFKVTIPADAPPGLYDVRVVNKWGISNPRAFVVGGLNEVMEKEPNNNDTEAQKVELGTTINGVVNAPTDVDYYSFAGKAGQRVVVSCLTLSIDSRMQAAVEVYDANGKQLAANSRYGGNRHHGNTDAVTDVLLPAD